MNLNDRITAFAKLSDFLFALVENKKNNVPDYLLDYYDTFQSLIKKIKVYNPWFIERFTINQLKAIAQSTNLEKITKWISPYTTQIENTVSKKVGVIMAGNIPLVGFHDFISVLISGHTIIIKVSSKDSHLPKILAEILVIIEPAFKDKIVFSDDKLSDFDAVIATGSNNTARYFDFYFSKYPNIIRKSRNSLAILSGNESIEELKGLADDILLYFGLGCRNVSKIYVPENYNFDQIFNAVFDYNFIANENKYANNYDYNRAIYLVDGKKFLDNGFFMIKEDEQLVSPISVLHFEYYQNTDKVKHIINQNSEKIQCIVSNDNTISENVVDFGKAQFPELWDYEDNVNIIEFLINI